MVVVQIEVEIGVMVLECHIWVCVKDKMDMEDSIKITGY